MAQNRPCMAQNPECMAQNSECVPFNKGFVPFDEECVPPDSESVPHQPLCMATMVVAHVTMAFVQKIKGGVHGSPRCVACTGPAVARIAVYVPCTGPGWHELRSVCHANHLLRHENRRRLQNNGPCSCNNGVCTPCNGVRGMIIT
jgi:hypothetical protein